jgi:DNA-binding response OmpR family regulator
VSSVPISRIFVVDDEYVIASTLAAILQVSGFSAKFFTDTPDLLISDVAMQSLSGIDLAIEMKAQCPKCEILLFSGQASTVDLLEGARTQGHGFHLLPKPVHPSELLSMLKTPIVEDGLDAFGATSGPSHASAGEIRNDSRAFHRYKAMSPGIDRLRHEKSPLPQEMT